LSSPSLLSFLAREVSHRVQTFLQYLIAAFSPTTLGSSLGPEGAGNFFPTQPPKRCLRRGGEYSFFLEGPPPPPPLGSHDARLIFARPSSVFFELSLTGSTLLGSGHGGFLCEFVSSFNSLMVFDFSYFPGLPVQLLEWRLS